MLYVYYGVRLGLEVGALDGCALWIGRCVCVSVGVTVVLDQASKFLM